MNETILRNGAVAVLLGMSVLVTGLYLLSRSKQDEALAITPVKIHFLSRPKGDPGSAFIMIPARKQEVLANIFIWLIFILIISFFDFGGGIGIKLLYLSLPCIGLLLNLREYNGRVLFDQEKITVKKLFGETQYPYGELSSMMTYVQKSLMGRTYAFSLSFLSGGKTVLTLSSRKYDHLEEVFSFLSDGHPYVNAQTYLIKR